MKKNKEQKSRQSTAEKRAEEKQKEEKRKKDEAIVKESLRGMKSQIQRVKDTLNTAEGSLAFASEALKMKENIIAQTTENAIAAGIDRFTRGLPTN